MIILKRNYTHHSSRLNVYVKDSHVYYIVYPGSVWEVSRSRVVAGRGEMEYCAVDSEGSGLLLLCHSNYIFVGDSVQPITKPDPTPEKPNENQPIFTFQQTDGEESILW